jgi:hypothetical protein
MPPILKMAVNILVVEYVERVFRGFVLCAFAFGNTVICKVHI